MHQAAVFPAALISSPNNSRTTAYMHDMTTALTFMECAWPVRNSSAAISLQDSCIRRPYLVEGIGEVVVVGALAGRRGNSLAQVLRRRRGPLLLHLGQDLLQQLLGVGQRRHYRQPPGSLLLIALECLQATGFSS